MVQSSARWTVDDKIGERIYLTQERWEHIIEPINHPEMADYEEELKDTIRFGKRTQDPINPQKYRYSTPFDHLVEHNTHIVAIVLYRYKEQDGEFLANNYVVTAYQKEIG